MSETIYHVLLITLSVFALTLTFSWSTLINPKSAPISSKKSTVFIAIIAETVIVVGLTCAIYARAISQGLSNPTFNISRVAKSSDLAPNLADVSTPHSVNQALKTNKSHKIVVVYKFGCSDCQGLYKYAQKHKDLYPSYKTLWIPTTDYNKVNSKFIADTHRYPTIYYWEQKGSTLKQRKLVNPTEQQVEEMLETVRKQ